MTYRVYLFATFVDILGAVVAAPIIPFICIELGIATTDIGLIISVFLIGFMICSGLTGLLVDRTGCKRMSLIMTLGSFVAFCLTGFAQSATMFVIGRLIGGLFCGSPTVAQAFASHIDGTEKKVFAYMQYGQVIMLAILSGNVAAALAQIHLRLPFFFLSALSLLAFLLCFYFGSDYDVTKCVEHANSQKQWQNGEISKMRVSFIFASILLMEMSNACMDFILPVVLATTYSFEPIHLAFFGCANAFWGLCALRILWFFTHRLGTRRVAVAASLSGLLAFIPLCLLPFQLDSVALGLMATSAVCTSFYRPPLEAWLQAKLSEAVPQHRQGFAMGIREVTLNIARSIVLPLYTRVLDGSFVGRPFTVGLGFRIGAVSCAALTLTSAFVFEGETRKLAQHV